MFEMFGEGQSGFKFVIAFIVVLALIALTAWLVRRFASERMGPGTARGRQPRLAVIDAASVDGRRRLVLIRRDNVEHLMMIGGPTDVVVEANIVRSAAPRDTQTSRPAAATDTLPRAVPLGEGTMWPLQPEPAPAPAPAARVEPPAPRVPPRPAPTPPTADEETEVAAEAEPAPSAAPPPAPPRRARPVQDPLVGLADEIARQPQPETTGTDPRSARREPRMARPQAAVPPSPPQAPSQPAETPAAADQNLAEMAQRLEAALRRPAAKPEGVAEPAQKAAPVYVPEQAEAEDYVPPPPPRTPAAADVRPARSETRPARSADRTAAPKGSLYDSLEQEMASLLNRGGKQS